MKITFLYRFKSIMGVLSCLLFWYHLYGTDVGHSFAIRRTITQRNSDWFFRALSDLQKAHKELDREKSRMRDLNLDRMRTSIDSLEGSLEFAQTSLLRFYEVFKTDGQDGPILEAIVCFVLIINWYIKYKQSSSHHIWCYKVRQVGSDFPFFQFN